MSINIGAADHRGFEHIYRFISENKNISDLRYGEFVFEEMYCVYRNCKHKMKEHDGKICKCKHKQTHFDVGFTPSVVIFYNE